MALTQGYGNGLGQNSEPSIKAIPFYVLEYLAMNTDVNHTKDQKDIVEGLANTRGIHVDRRTIKATMDLLIDELQYPIKCEKRKRNAPVTGNEKEKQIIREGFYFEHEFSQEELHLIMESLLFSKHVPQLESNDILKKLKELQSKFFDPRLSKISRLTDDRPNHASMTDRIDIIDQAIENEKKIKFNYGRYGVNKKCAVEFQLKENEDGTIREYVVSPYNIVVNNSKYYLVCKRDGKDYLENFRLDRIENVDMIDEPLIPVNKVKGYNLGLNINQYMKEHIFMFSDEIVCAKLLIGNKYYIIGDILDFFGKDIKFKKYSDDQLLLSVKANKTSIVCFAKMYLDFVTVLEPESLKKDVLDSIIKAKKRYINI